MRILTNKLCEIKIQCGNKIVDAKKHVQTLTGLLRHTHLFAIVLTIRSDLLIIPRELSPKCRVCEPVLYVRTAVTLTREESANNNHTHTAEEEIRKFSEEEYWKYI